MNSSRMNRLEELGRVDAERASTRKGKKNLKAEKKRTAKQLKASADDSYGKFGSKAKKSGKINK